MHVKHSSFLFYVIISSPPPSNCDSKSVPLAIFHGFICSDLAISCLTKYEELVGNCQRKQNKRKSLFPIKRLGRLLSVAFLPIVERATRYIMFRQTISVSLLRGATHSLLLFVFEYFYQITALSLIPNRAHAAAPVISPPHTTTPS